MTPRDPGSFSHPNFYLKRAQAKAGDVRAWIRRHHPPTIDPEDDGVEWVLDVFDVLDQQLALGVEAADVMLPSVSNTSHQRDTRLRFDVSHHAVARAADSIQAVIQWASQARWSAGVTPDDLDRLDLLARKARENIARVRAEVDAAALEQ